MWIECKIDGYYSLINLDLIEIVLTKNSSLGLWIQLKTSSNMYEFKFNTVEDLLLVYEGFKKVILGYDSDLGDIGYIRKLKD